jgi:hypothetical protein
VERLETLSEAPERDAPVLELAALIAGNDRDPGWAMGESNRRLGDILVLSALSACAKGFDAAFGEERLIGMPFRARLCVGHGAFPGDPKRGAWSRSSWQNVVAERRGRTTRQNVVAGRRDRTTWQNDGKEKGRDPVRFVSPARRIYPCHTGSS